MVAKGTAEALADLRKIIEVLDVPLRKVEIEVRIVRVDKEDATPFQVKPTNVEAPNGNAVGNALQIGSAKPDYFTILNPLLKSNRARTLMEVKATAVNNIGASYSTGAFGQGLPLPKAELQFVPTVNSDNTVTVVLQSTLTTPALSTPLPKNQTTTVVNVRDGETVIISGLQSTGSNHLTLTFLTTRIVKDGEK